MMPIFEFLAEVVKCYVEDEVLTVGFSDSNKEPENYVIITRLDEDGLDPDDTVGVQTSFSDQEYTRSVSKIFLNISDIEIIFNKNGIEKTGFKKIIVSFDKSFINIDLIKEYLNKIFGGTSVLLNVLV